VTEVLAEADWTARRAAHERRVDGLLRGHAERGRAGRKHPVEDFLFTYYSYRPAQLRRWHPGAGVALAGTAARERLDWRDHVELDGAVTLDVAAWLGRRGAALEHVRALLEATSRRPPQWGCFGLHEWAMVYRAGEVRHESWPLRLGDAGTDAVVEANRLRCSHFDAFRFFTDEARPLNHEQPRRERQIDLEQPGCLHATMDLYKWAYKLSPALPSELVVDCFEQARWTRELDMRASPYDLAALGYRPVRVETPEGKAEYVAAQRSIAERGQALRARLLDALRPLTPARPRS
jgi:hypothetical protein